MNPSAPTRRSELQPALSHSAAAAWFDRNWLIVAFLLAVGVAVLYSPSLQFQFILDDHHFTADPRIQESGHIWDYFANVVWAQFTGGPPSFYRPVFLLWMRLNFLLSGDSPWGWHLLSIAKHILVAALLGILVWRLLRDRTAALVAATLFALHPAQTESVSWVTVPDPLMTAGVLGAILCYLKYQSGSARAAVRGKKRRGATATVAPQRSFAWLAAAYAVYFGALLSKEAAIIVPVTILGIACVWPATSSQPDDHHDTFGSRFLPALLQCLPFVVITALYLLLRINALSGKISPSTQHLSWSILLFSWPSTLWFYVNAMLWPVKSYSFADPTLVERFSVSAFLWPLLALACAAVLLTGAILWLLTKAQRDFSEPEAIGVETAMVAGVSLLILPLLLTLNLNALNPGDFLHGRYTYLPLAGLMLLVAVGWHVAGNMQTPLLCVVGIVAVAYSYLTFVQQKQWKDDATVFTVAHQLAPHNAPVTQNVANVHVQAALDLDQEGRCQEAIPILKQVIQDYPENWYAWGGLGDCYVQSNDLVLAEQALHRAADLSKDAHVIEQWQELRAHMGLSTSSR